MSGEGGTKHKVVVAAYSYLPSGSGDGYGYGGGAIVTIDGAAVFFGEGSKAHVLAKFTADAINAYGKALPDDDENPF